MNAAGLYETTLQHMKCYPNDSLCQDVGEGDSFTVSKRLSVIRTLESIILLSISHIFI